MRIEHVTVGDDLAALVDATWPDATWSEVVEYALALAVEHAHRTDEDTDQPGDNPPILAGDLDGRIAAAFDREMTP